MLQRVNTGWRKFHKDKRFGSTYQVAHPPGWTNHHLASSINNAILTHLKKGSSILEKHYLQTNNKNINIGKQAVQSKTKERYDIKVTYRAPKNRSTSISSEIIGLILNNNSTTPTNVYTSNTSQGH